MMIVKGRWCRQERFQRRSRILQRGIKKRREGVKCDIIKCIVWRLMLYRPGRLAASVWLLISFLSSWFTCIVMLSHNHVWLCQSKCLLAYLVNITGSFKLIILLDFSFSYFLIFEYLVYWSKRDEQTRIFKIKKL